MKFLNEMNNESQIWFMIHVGLRFFSLCISSCLLALINTKWKLMQKNLNELATLLVLILVYLLKFIKVLLNYCLCLLHSLLSIKQVKSDLKFCLTLPTEIPYEGNDVSVYCFLLHDFK